MVLCDEQTQMTSPIQSIPLYHGDNRGICLREHTNFYVVMLVSFSCFCVFRLPALPFFGWHHEEKNRLSDLLDEKFLLLILNASVLSMPSFFLGAKSQKKKFKKTIGPIVMVVEMNLNLAVSGNVAFHLT